MADFAIDKCAEMLQAELVDERAELEAAASIYQGEIDRLQADRQFNMVEWAIGKLHELDAAEQAIKQRAEDHVKYLLSEIKARRSGLLFKWGQEIQETVDAGLAGKKRKSITYATGKAGYAAGRDSLELNDEAKVIAWAEVNCPDAVKVVKTIQKKPITDHIKATGDEPPGCQIINPGETFYVGPVKYDKPQLPMVQVQQLSHQSVADFFGKPAPTIDLPPNNAPGTIPDDVEPF